MLLGVIAGGLVGVALGVIAFALGAPAQSVNPNLIQLVGFLPMIPIGICVLRHVLKRQWPGFKIGSCRRNKSDAY